MNLDSAAFEAKIQESGVVILDVRTKAEFEDGCISNAVNIDFNGYEFSSEISKLDKSKTYAVYCRSGRRSTDAISEMRNEGFISLVHLDGGIIDWAKAGLSLVKP